MHAKHLHTSARFTPQIEEQRRWVRTLADMAMRSRKLLSGGHDAFDAATQRLYHEMLDRERRATTHLLANRTEPPLFGSTACSTFGSTSSSLSSLSYLSSSSGGTGGLSHSLRRPAIGGSIRRLDESLPTRTPFGAALALPSLPPLAQAFALPVRVPVPVLPVPLPVFLAQEAQEAQEAVIRLRGWPTSMQTIR